MKTLEEIIKEFPEDIRLPLYEAFQAFQKEVIHEDLKEIKEEIKKVWQAIDKLAEAQKRTEERVNELAEAQKRTEERINELAEAQKRTEERLNELAEAQERTEGEIRKIWQAINKLTESHNKLVEEHRKTRENLGGLSHAFGYVLEDRAIKSLPRILKEEYGIDVEGKLKRDYIKVGNEYIEVNIYGKAKKDGQEYTLIGEVKSRLTKRAINSFIKKCNKVGGTQIRIIISYIFTPQIREYLKEKGILIIPSHEIDI